MAILFPPSNVRTFNQIQKMKRIAFYFREFRLCEWPSEPTTHRWSPDDSDDAEYAEAVTSAMENGVVFSDQDRVKHYVFMNCLKDRGGISVSHVWQPKEGDNWPAPEGAEIIRWDKQNNKECKDKFCRKCKRIAVLRSESVEEEDYLKIPSGTAIKRAKAKLEKAGRPEDFPWPAKESSPAPLDSQEELWNELKTECVHFIDDIYQVSIENHTLEKLKSKFILTRRTEVSACDTCDHKSCGYPNSDCRDSWKLGDDYNVTE